MQQSNVIAAFIFAAFLIYITLKGELPTYMGFLLSSAPSTYTPPTASVAPVGASTQAAPAAGGKTGGMSDFGGLAGGILGGSGGGDFNSMMNDPSGKGAITTFGNAALMMFGLPPVAGAAAGALTGG
jgi:hypothetical protein